MDGKLGSVPVDCSLVGFHVVRQVSMFCEVGVHVLHLICLLDTHERHIHLLFYLPALLIGTKLSVLYQSCLIIIACHNWSSRTTFGIGPIFVTVVLEHLIGDIHPTHEPVVMGGIGELIVSKYVAELINN